MDDLELSTRPRGRTLPGTFARPITTRSRRLFGRMRSARLPSFDEDLEDKRKEVCKKSRPLLRDAGRADREASASAAGKVQTMVFFKLLMDVLKIIGAAICSVSALGIAVARNQPTSMKTYATVISEMAFVSVAAGGILTVFG